MSAIAKAVVGMMASGLAACASTGSATRPDLTTVQSVDLNRYAGTWYEIARLPARFEKDCTGVTATYELRDNGEVTVINRCRKGSLEGPAKEARGHAWLPDKADPGKLKVSFFWPFRADYWIVELDPEYRWAAVGTPDRKYMWVLSRTPTLPADVYDPLIQRMAQRGFEVARLEKVLQAPQ